MTEEFPDTAQYGNYSEEGLFCDSSIHVHSAEVVRHWIELAVHPILLLQGTVGNMLAIPVLVSMSRSSWSTITYLALLGVTDLIILLIRCGDRW
ncbi:unnamed protein product [Lymnaea stagnalis]|uniref:G-protein coupled receptors family 1 profile domain-containing protein n=1 Tax=Lymnaea stagnalis TaxID=6523 RepID=A0AAV2HUH0_LYMST